MKIKLNWIANKLILIKSDQSADENLNRQKIYFIDLSKIEKQKFSRNSSFFVIIKF